MNCENALELMNRELDGALTVSYTHLRAHETVLDLVCRLLLEKKKRKFCCWLIRGPVMCAS